MTLTMWQCWNDVGGWDAWLSSWWKDDPETGYCYQWWTGWHSPENLAEWPWPDNICWSLIGHERWDCLNDHTWKAEAHYAHPNASTAPRGHDLIPLGHWIVTYDEEGNETDRVWSDDILAEGPLYLKGGGSKGKGKGKGNYPKGKGKGNYPKGKGKGFSRKQRARAQARAKRARATSPRARAMATSLRARARAIRMACRIEPNGSGLWVVAAA